MKMISLELFGHVFAECFTLDQDFRLQREMRDDACLAYIQEGKQEIYSPTQKIQAMDRESILMKCGNYIANFRDVTPTAQFKSVVFHLDPEAIKKAFDDKDLDFLRVDKSKVARDPALKMEQNELLDSFVSSMMPYFDKPQLAKDELLLLKLKELIYILSDNITGSGKYVIDTAPWPDTHLALVRSDGNGTIWKINSSQSTVVSPLATRRTSLNTRICHATARVSASSVRTMPRVSGVPIERRATSPPKSLYGRQDTIELERRLRRNRA